MRFDTEGGTPVQKKAKMIAFLIEFTRNNVLIEKWSISIMIFYFLSTMY